MEFIKVLIFMNCICALLVLVPAFITHFIGYKEETVEVLKKMSNTIDYKDIFGALLLIFAWVLTVFLLKNYILEQDANDAAEEHY